MELIIQYNFDASLKTITFDGKTAIDLERIGVIYNVTDGIEIFNFSKPAAANLGGTVATNVLTLDYDTTTMDDTDDLAIYYKEGPMKVLNLSLSSNTVVGNLLMPVTDVSEYTSFSIHLTGLGGGTPVFTVEASNDNTNWVAVSLQGMASTLGGVSTLATLNTLFGGALNWRYMRIRVTTAGTGGSNATATIMLRALSVQAAAISNVTSNQAGSWDITTRPTPSASVGFSTHHKLISAATTNATSVKASAGTIGVLHLHNTSGATKYFKLYNKASAPTVGTDVPIYTIPIATGAFAQMSIPAMGLRLATGIAYAITDGLADSDNTAVGANDVIVAMSYV
jgi:hypothetical protein